MDIKASDLAMAFVDACSQKLKKQGNNKTQVNSFCFLCHRYAVRMYFYSKAKTLLRSKFFALTFLNIIYRRVEVSLQCCKNTYEPLSGDRKLW